MELEEITVHALLLSFPIKTHLVPLIQLAKRLSTIAAAQGGGNCTFVFTTIVSYKAAGDGWATAGQDEAAAADGRPPFTLRTIAVPDGLPSAHPRSLMVDLIQACLNMKAPTLRFLPHLLQSSPPLSLIIADSFVPWALELSASVHLPLFSFFTSTASCCCVMSHAPSLVANGSIPWQGREQENECIITCPGVPPLRPIDLPVSMQLQDVSHPQFQFTLKMLGHLEEAAGLILNTCNELEADAIKALQERCPVYAVGPLCLPPTGGEEDPLKLRQQVDAADHPRPDYCLTWLDAQAPGSVLYVSFGTLADFSEEQIRELAMGLEHSEQRFLWVICNKELAIKDTMAGVLPAGFLERTKGQCHLTSWAPQLQVLKHEAMGGFFTHCGWNSLLENITLGGLPMLCWPDKAEQSLNARLVVDVWKLGLPFQVGRKDCVASRHEIEQAVRGLMQGEEAEEMRRRGRELKKQMGEVVKQGGSSILNVELLVKAMMTNKAQRPSVW